MYGKELLEEIAARVRSLPPSAGTCVVVGIDGCGDAGKSTFATLLSEHLTGSQVVHTDDFASWHNPANWWPRLIQQVLEPLSRGEAGRYQRYDWVERRLAEWHEVNAPVVLLEGVTATRREFQPYLALRLWVECPRELRLRRGLERDGEDMEPAWLEWMRAEDEYCAAHRPKENADLVISGSA